MVAPWCAPRRAEMMRLIACWVMVRTSIPSSGGQSGPSFSRRRVISARVLVAGGLEGLAHPL